jgi:hypothetical protein
VTLEVPQGAAVPRGVVRGIGLTLWSTVFRIAVAAAASMIPNASSAVSVLVPPGKVTT